MGSFNSIQCLKTKEPALAKEPKGEETMSTANTYMIDLVSVGEFPNAEADSFKKKLLDNNSEGPEEKAMFAEIVENIVFDDGNVEIYVDFGFYEWRHNCREVLGSVIKSITEIVGDWKSGSEFAWQEDTGDWMGKYSFSLEGDGRSFVMSVEQEGADGYSFSNIEDMDQDELHSVIDELGLDLDPDGFDSVDSLRSSIIQELKD